MQKSPPTLAEIQAARERIRPYVNRTPVMTSRTIDGLAGARLFFKCENFQKVGAFKARGAHNAVFSLSDAEAAKGVVTHSSGNHAAALALAARNRGIPAYIVMPSNAPETKKASVARYGGKITFCEPTQASREGMADKLVAETGGALIHPYDDPRVIAGQGTAALELFEDCPPLDVLMAPVGGGGFLSGTALSGKATKPSIRVFGAEPLGADDAARSYAARTLVPQTGPKTIADGLLTSLCPLTFGIIMSKVDGIFTVSEEQIVSAMRLVWSVMKIIIEPSSAVPVAAALARRDPLQGKSVGVMLTGGNVDLDKLPWMK